MRFGGPEKLFACLLQDILQWPVKELLLVIEGLDEEQLKE